MKFSFFGIKTEVTFAFFAVLCVMLLFDKSGLFIPVFTAAVLHETGHIFCMWVQNNAPTEIKLIPAGVKIYAKQGKTYIRDIWVSLCGPLVNILAFLGLYLNYFLYQKERVLYFAVSNLILGVINLLPVKGLDGGNILLFAVSKRKGCNKGERALFVSSVLVLFIILTVIFYLGFRKQFNLSLLIIFLYLFTLFILKR